MSRKKPVKRKDGMVRVYAAWGSSGAMLLRKPRLIKVKGELVWSGLFPADRLALLSIGK